MESRLFLISILTFFMFFSSSCVTPPKMYETTKIENVQNKNKQAIFDKTRQWFSETFVSGKSVVDYEDKNAGVIIGNGVYAARTLFSSMNAHYKMRVDIKDSKVRINTKVSKYVIVGGQYSGVTAGNIPSGITDKTKKHIKDLELSLLGYLNGKSAPNDNW